MEIKFKQVNSKLKKKRIIKSVKNIYRTIYFSHLACGEIPGSTCYCFGVREFRNVLLLLLAFFG